MPSQAHPGAAQEAPDIGQWEGQDVPLVRPSSCNVKGGIPSSRRYLPTSSRCASPGAWTCLLFADGDDWCESGQHSVEAVLKIREKRRAACLDLYKWYTTCMADISKPDTPWAFRAKLAGQAQGSAQEVEPIPLYEAADNLLRCVEDQRRWNLSNTYNNLKIAIVDAVQMSALVPTAELKQPGQFVCSFHVVSTLLVARGLAHHLVIFSIIRINCGKIS